MLCPNIPKNIREKLLELTNRIGGTAIENTDLTELCFLIDNEQLKLEEQKKLIEIMIPSVEYERDRVRVIMDKYEDLNRIIRKAKILIK